MRQIKLGPVLEHAAQSTEGPAAASQGESQDRTAGGGGGGERQQ